MKKVLYVLLLIGALLIGSIITDASRDSQNKEIHDKIEDFEDTITNPNNGYKGIKDSDMSPNITNSIGKKGEDLIDGVFDFGFGLLEKLIGG